MKVFLGFLLILIISGCGGNSMKNENQIEAFIGQMELVELPEQLETVRIVHNQLSLETNKIVLYYYRKKADYDIWSVWIWKPGHEGERHYFNGISNGVAYLILDKSDWFNFSNQYICLKITTEEFSFSDPGNDMYWYIEEGEQMVVISRRNSLYTLENYEPRILSSGIYENENYELFILVKLSGKYGLPTNIGSAGFELSGGLTVIDAFNYSIRNDTNQRHDNYAENILLLFDGDIYPTNEYFVSHPDFSNSRIVDMSLLPSPTPELTDSVKQQLPEPILDEHPEWIDVYWAAWKFMYEKITKGNEENGFEPLYIDEGFNENIYQWDSCFMVAYAIYGLEVFPAMATLDNFYNHQRETDGYICRCYNEDTGLATGDYDINPPLYAWMEWRYYYLTGDTSRLERVIPVLDDYFQWIKNNARGNNGNGLYFITDLGSGMDNSPRESYVQEGAWIDISAQQALSALYISRLAEVAGMMELNEKYKIEYETLKTNINTYLWNEEYQNYYDRKENGDYHVRNTIASFWPMLAEISDTNQAFSLINEHLKNPDEFYRTHLFPSLSASDIAYDDRGHYWRGGVWAPTDFATIKGIALFDEEFAFEAATNHIQNISKVYHEFKPEDYPYKMPTLNEPNIPRNGNGINQIWETYAPDYIAPATRWDAELLVRQKFCGWSGVGPVALFIENILDIDANGINNTITWHLHFLGKNGINRLKFGNNEVSIYVSERIQLDHPVTLVSQALYDFDLKLYNLDGTLLYDGPIPAGDSMMIMD